MGKFEIREVASGVKFDLKAVNGTVIATSEVYRTPAACRRGILSVAKNAADAPLEDQTVPGARAASNPRFELFQDKGGQYRFRLRARNGKVILSSQGYTSRGACAAGVESVRKNAAESDEK